MPGIIFRKCECGRELKIFFKRGERKQKYACECKRTGEIDGVITEMYSTSGHSVPMKEPEWMRVPIRRIEDIP